MNNNPNKKTTYGKEFQMNSKIVVEDSMTKNNNVKEGMQMEQIDKDQDILVDMIFAYQGENYNRLAEKVKTRGDAEKAKREAEAEKLAKVEAEKAKTEIVKMKRPAMGSKEHHAERQVLAIMRYGQKLGQIKVSYPDLRAVFSSNLNELIPALAGLSGRGYLIEHTGTSHPFYELTESGKKDEARENRKFPRMTKSKVGK